VEKQYFIEEQKFNPTYVLLIMFPSWCAANIVFGIGLYQQLQLGKPWGDEPMSDSALMVMTFVINLILIGIAVLMLKTKMITEIRENGFYYRYLPFIFREKKISMEEIERYEVRQYKPIREYGGWGFRQRSRRIRRAGLAYNVKGNLGLQLYLRNGKKILFGTQRKEAIDSAMNKLMNYRG
jgi:hypothetical protein